jgi:hypothetical protein
MQPLASDQEEWNIIDVGNDDGNVLIGHYGDSSVRAKLVIDGCAYEAVVTDY